MSSITSYHTCYDMTTAMANMLQTLPTKRKRTQISYAQTQYDFLEDSDEEATDASESQLDELTGDDTSYDLRNVILPRNINGVCWS